MNKNILVQRLNMPLDMKIMYTEKRIRDWHYYHKGNVYVSFSGGKDSQVLLHITRKLFPQTKAVFYFTGLEYPEILATIRSTPDVEWIKPKLSFREVLNKYGYPIISKEVSQKIYEIRNTNSEKLRKKRLYGDAKGNGKLSEKWMFLIDAPFKISSICCNKLKKDPSKRFEKCTECKPIIGTRVTDSSLRRTSYLNNGGCNVFNSNRPVSNPLSFWTEKDIYDYVQKENICLSDIYHKGYHNTGCVFCLFGMHLENTGKFNLLKKTHTKMYDFCMQDLEYDKIFNFMSKHNIKNY